VILPVGPVTPTQDALRSWHDFFLLVGGASATLLGLLFVAVALVVNLPTLPDERDRQLFSSPIVAQLAYALGLSALCLAPWRDAHLLGLVVTGAGGAALFQAVGTARLLHQRHRERPPTPLHVWLTVAAAPLASALLCALAGVALLADDLRGLWLLALAIVTLDLIGLLNAWRLFLWVLGEHRQKTG
jgi:hypothetical protein